MGQGPKVSVITVCYNAEKTIGTALESVLGQVYGGFEYVLKDGGSTDRTNQVIESYRKKFEDRGVPFLHLSEPDHGIFDAMNKGVEACSGEWVCFMNADDRFYDGSVLDQIFTGRVWEDADILYGDALECEFGEYYYFTKCLDRIERRMPFNHQASFTRKSLLQRSPFDLRYRIAADYNFLLDAYQAGAVFCDTGRIISVISKEGVSTVDLYHTFLETAEIQKSHGVYPYSDSRHRRKLAVVRMKQFGMDHFPRWMKYGIRKLQRHIRKQREVKVCS